MLLSGISKCSIYIHVHVRIILYVHTITLKIEKIAVKIISDSAKSNLYESSKSEIFLT